MVSWLARMIGKLIERGRREKNGKLKSEGVSRGLIDDC